MHSSFHRPWAAGLLCAALVALPVSAAGQQAQTEAPDQEQVAPAKPDSTVSGTPFEGVIRKLRSFGFFQSSPTGLYPEVTSVYPGGWVAFGGGYRRHFSEKGTFNVDGAWSLQNFKEVETSVVLPPVFDRRVTFEVGVRWMDAPSVAFYGIGNDSRDQDETSFLFRPTTVGVTASISPWKFVRFGGGADYVSIETVPTLDGPVEAVEAIGRPPGLEQGPDYLRSHAVAQVDWRRAPGYTTTGGFYRLQFEDFSDRSGSNLGFRSVEAEIVQLVPVVRDRTVMAFRGLMTMTDDRDGADVPFYLMPAIGGSSSVRGYSSFRFRGNHRWLMSAEYRWTAVRFLDVALFYDTGKVAMESSQLSFSDLKWSYGAGARLHSTRRTVFRFDVARNDEHKWHFIWSMGPAF